MIACCVCECVCVCVCQSVSAYKCVYLYVFVCVCIFFCVCLCVYVCRIFLGVLVCLSVPGFCLYVSVCMRSCVRMYVLLCAREHACVRLTIQRQAGCLWGGGMERTDPRRRPEVLGVRDGNPVSQNGSEVLSESSRLWFKPRWYHPRLTSSPCLLGTVSQGSRKACRTTRLLHVE